MKRLDEANVNLKLDKCPFTAEDIEWVGYKLSQQGVTQLRSFLGALNQFNKFIPYLAQLYFPFRNLLKKDNEWNWGEEHEKAFKLKNKEIKKATMLNHFKRQCPLRIICDASKSGLGAVLQHEENNEWKPISFALRFSTELESKNSINELEFLAIV